METFEIPESWIEEVKKFGPCTDSLKWLETNRNLFDCCAGWVSWACIRVPEILDKVLELDVNVHPHLAHFACINGDSEILQRVLELGKPVGTASTFAAEFGYIECLKLLHEHGVELDRALYFAAKHSQYSTMEYLVGAGVSKDYALGLFIQDRSYEKWQRLVNL
jgi:hypothetical protein